MEELWKEGAQQCRIEALYNRFLEENFYNGNADKLAGQMESDLRPYDKMMRCYVLLHAGKPETVAAANDWLRKLAPYRFCQFMPVTVLEILQDYRNLLEPDNAAALEEYLVRELPNNALPEFDFVGVNDNFPLLAMYMMFAGGQYLGDNALLEVGYRRLAQLTDMLERRGSLSEFNSPHYYLMELSPLAMLARRTQDPQVRQTALDCEARLWTELLGRSLGWNSASAGPYSRGYTPNFNGGTGATRLLHILLGEEESEPTMSSLNHIPYPVYHCPEWLVDWYHNRSYPHSYISTYEVNSSTDSLPHGKRKGHYFGAKDASVRDPYQEEELYEYPGGDGVAVTYIQPAYSLGTATREWHNGLHSYNFVAAYQKRDADSYPGFVFSKYIVNDKMPWQYNEYEAFGMQENGFNTWDMGRKLCLQDRDTALVLYKPKAFTAKRTFSARLCLIFPHRICAPLEEIWLGNRKLEAGEGSSQTPCSVYIRDGAVFMAIHPAQLTDLGRDYAVSVERSVNGYTAVSFYNYRGEEKDFAARGFLLTCSGFAFEIRSQSEYESFAAFREAMSKYILADELLTNTHVRQTYQRRFTYRCADRSLSGEYTPHSEGIRYLMRGKQPYGAPKLQATGLDAQKLPFMQTE